jgi:hypothetical protein
LAIPTIQNSRKTKAPLIIRTRGHRLEGIWLWFSYGMIINAIRGIHVLVPKYDKSSRIL